MVEIPGFTVHPNDPQVSVDTTVPDDPVINLDPKENATPSNDTAASRAMMMHFGLGPVLGKPADELNQLIAGGNEQNLRRQAASTLDSQDMELRRNLVKDIAANSQGPLDPKAMQSILTGGQPTDPDTVSEQAYGHEYMKSLDASTSSASGNMKGTPYDDASKYDPETVNRIKGEGGELLGRRAYASKVLQDINDDIAQQSWAGWGADFAKQFVPFYSDIKLRGLTDTPAMSGLFLGNNLDEETQNLLQMPFQQYKSSLDTIVANLKKDNPQMAAQFVGALLGQSNSDKFLNNWTTLQSVVDVAGGPSLAALTRKTLATDTATTVASMVKSQKFGKDGPQLKDTPAGSWWEQKAPGSDEWYLRTKANAAEGAGDFDESGVKKATAQTNSNLIDATNEPSNAAEQLVSSLKTDQERFDQAPGAGGQNIANRLRARTEAVMDQFLQRIKTIASVERIPDFIASEVAQRQYKDELKSEYRGMSSSISDISGPVLDDTTKTYTYTMHITQPDGTLFKQWIQAKAYAKLNGLLDANIVKDTTTGVGYKLTKTVPLDATSKVVRDTIASTTETQLQQSRFGGWTNALIGRWRTPKEVLSTFENSQRELATHGPNVLQKFLQESSKDILDLPKGLPFSLTRKNWNEWWRSLDFARKDLDANGLPGHFFDDGAQMDDFYLRTFQRTPSEQEKMAYFAVKRNVELDRAFRAISEHKEMSNWGAEQHQVYFTGKDNRRTDSGFFAAKRMNHMPIGTDTMYIKMGKGEGKLYRGSDPGFQRLYNLVSPRVQNGELKALEIWNTEARPLSKFGRNIGDAKVRYIITDSAESKALDIGNLINRRGGGHFIYDYENYIKQANIKSELVGGRIRHWYEGDTTLMPINIKALGEDVAKHLNAVREFIKDGKDAEAEAYHNTHELPMSWEDHSGWYKEQKSPDGALHPPRLNVNEPFYVVPKNKMTLDLHNEVANRYPDTFFDGTKTGNAARQHMTEFTGERDAHEMMTIRDDGTKDKPIYQYEPATLVDPIATMNRSLQNIIKSQFINDMKAYSVNHWLKQAVQYMDIKGKEGGMDAAFHSPFYYFHNADEFWKKAPAKPQDVMTLKAAKHQIDQFLGMANKTETALHTITSTLADTIYKGFGPKLVPDWMLSQVKDPASYVRSLTVHAKLGLFNIPSLFVQLSTHTNIWGIAGPRHAAPGTAAMLLHQWSRINRDPAILAKLDEYASNLGWRDGHWLEANEEGINRGFFNLGHSHAMEDAPQLSKVIQTKWGQLLDAGQIFFKEGAQSVRQAAWYTAHHEFRTDNPVGAMTKRDWDKVQARAADLDHNMSRAGNSQLQSGIGSFPFQFVTYNLRLMELMTGKRLTYGEKLGLFTTSSLMYGIPLGGIGLYGFPFGEMMKHSAQENGYVAGDKWVNDLFMRGGLDVLGAIITGNGNYQAGTQFNAAERWGTGKGIDPIAEAMEGDSMWKVLVGASGTTFYNTIANSSGFLKAMGSVLTGNKDLFPVTSDDYLDLFNEFSEYSNLRKMLIGLNTGKVMSKNNTYLGDTTKMNAVWQAFSGLSQEGVININDTFKLQEAEKANYQAAEKMYIQQMHRGWQAIADNDRGNAEKFFTRAKTVMDQVGMPVELRIRAMKAAASSFNRSLVKSSDYDYLMRDVPQGQENDRRQTWQKKQDLDAARKANQ